MTAQILHSRGRCPAGAEGVLAVSAACHLAHGGRNFA